MIGTEEKKTDRAKEISMEPKISMEDKIRDQVKKSLENAEGIVEIKVHNLWDNRYRANVWCKYTVETDYASVEAIKIDYSYFVHVSEDGIITKSSPELVRMKGEDGEQGKEE